MALDTDAWENEEADLAETEVALNPVPLWSTPVFRDTFFSAKSLSILA